MPALTKADIARINRGAPFPKRFKGGKTMDENLVAPPTDEELNLLRRDAGQSDANAVASLRNHDDAKEALERWRNSQQ
jgi:hypothetical protein